MKKMMRYFVRMVVPVLVLACCAVHVHALDKEYYAQTSKLASGKWVKIAVDESGIYQITADDARRWGLGSDLSQIHVFGYGGAPLSEIMLGDNYADDLPQMPVVRTDDRILFYAQGPITWRSLSNGFAQLQVQHPYAQSGCYLITNDSRFSDIAIEKATNEPAGEVVTSYLERLFHERDSINPGETGRRYLGEDFRNRTHQVFNFNLDGLIEGSQVSAYIGFAALTTGASSNVKYTVNDSLLSFDNKDIIKKAGTYDHYNHIRSLKSFKLAGTTSLKLGVSYSCDGKVELAQLDFITINYWRQLTLKSGKLVFGLNDASMDKQYRLSGCSGTTHVWDVTRPFAPVELNVVTDDGTVTFSPTGSGRMEFVAFDESAAYFTPEYLGDVSNQNIHGEPVPDMIILSPSEYLEQARRVADLHEQYDNFRVLVLDHEKVFNEFSSGTRDAMAYRRLCKMFYDRNDSVDGHRLGYLLLMGSGTYNNRQIPTSKDAPDYPRLLTWQSLGSRNDDNSITTDDYFGILDDGSGASTKEKMDTTISAGATGDGKMSIAVGRMIVKSVSEAQAVVNKLVKYVTKPDYGSWKNQVLMVADDEDQGAYMVSSKEMISRFGDNGGEDMVINYVFTDAFDCVSEGGGRTYPDARDKMFKTLNEGVLWWNYIGHASTQNWTAEGLMMRSDVETRLYYRHLPVLFAATCEYTRFDNSVLSSGEQIFLNANGGAIAVICPARIANGGLSDYLTNAVGQYAFSRDDQGLPRRIGDIVRLAKSRSTTQNNRRYFLFGDPAMRLAWAPYTAVVDSINGHAVGSDVRPEEIKAREQIEFSGKIVGSDGELATDFNGAIVSTLFGPEQTIWTHGYYTDPQRPSDGKKVDYNDRPNRLAITVDTVINGRFTVRMVIPSEVNNEYENYHPSLINLYAYDTRNNHEAKGSNQDFIIRGYLDEEVADTIGPLIITLGLNDDTFVDGSDVNESPLVLATVSDESGVNFSSAGIGHSMTLTLDGTNSYNDVVSYYTPMNARQGTMGSINYQLNDLKTGPHSLRLRVWDVYNNMSEKTITFNVVNGLAPEISDVYCTSNPASVETSFYVKHNRPDAVVSVTIEVYDLMGRLVWRTTQSGRSDMYTTSPITWDLTDLGGRRVPHSIYVYRATISTDGVKEATKAKKLAVTGE